MKILKALFLFMFLCQPVAAQEVPFFIDYSWEENPNYTVDETTNEEVLELKHKIVTEFFFVDDNNLTEYFLEHRVIWLNSDSEIENFNKIYLPYSSSTQLEVQKARVITRTGKVLPLDESDILTAQDEETGRQYHYFAFEGIEKGSFIEYYYVLRKSPEYQGKRLLLQSGITKKNVEFDLLAPSNLAFAFKSYNDLPAVEQDTLSKDKLHWHLRIKDLKKLEEEEGAAYNASRAAIVYKLDRNLANNSRDFASYGKISQNIYSFYYPEHSKSTAKKIREFVDQATGNAEQEEASLVRNLEFFIKTNVYHTEGSGEELSDLNTVLDRKVANETGLLKLYAACLKSLGIEHEIVITSDRQELKFDSEFEATNFLTDFLLFFPKSNAYLSPIENSSRFGYPPAFLTDNYGLFIKEITVGTLTSGLGSVRYIEPVAAEKTFDEMFVDVAFDPEDLTTTSIHLDRALNGYYGMYIHPFINLINEKDREELIESFAKNLDEDVNILEKQVLNDDPALFGVKPLQFVLDFESDAFVEKAGNKYLFKIGELIGEQIQMYQEKQRVLPLENEFQRSYLRTLRVKLPEGYKVANLDDLNMDNSYSADENELLSFKSFYEVKDNVITIKADEHYKVNIIDTPLYEEYRKIINSAADFNKITLVLEKVL